MKRFSPVSMYWRTECAYKAARGGHLSLIKKFINKENITWIDWNWCMSYAIKGDHKEIVDFCINKGAIVTDLDIEHASNRRHYELVDFLKQKMKEN